jgi:hypothetical protein
MLADEGCVHIRITNVGGYPGMAYISTQRGRSVVSNIRFFAERSKSMVSKEDSSGCCRYVAAQCKNGLYLLTK